MSEIFAIFTILLKFTKLNGREKSQVLIREIKFPRKKSKVLLIRDSGEKQSIILFFQIMYYKKC